MAALITLAGALWLMSTGPAEAGTSVSGSAPSVTGSGHLPVAADNIPPGIGSGPDGVVLLAQSPWVSDRQNFHLRLEITVRNQADEQVQLVAYNRLTTRTAFDDALSGRIDGYAIYQTAPLNLSTLPADAAGGVVLDIPVNPRTVPSTARVPAFNAAAGSGVFPVQVQLVTAGVPRGKPLTTYLVYAEPSSASGLPKLSVSLTLPVHADPAVEARGQVVGLPPGDSSGLAALVGVLSAHPGVNLSLAITPQTLDNLASTSGSAVDRATAAALAELVHVGHIQVLPQAYASVTLNGWDTVGLTSELGHQLSTGAAVLATEFGKTPSPLTWVVNGSLDTATLRTLESAGASQLILPDVELSALPAIARENTFAQPTSLLGTGTRSIVYGADAGLTADFSNPGGPVLAASQLLAEMAMIQLEQPGYIRGVAVLPPPGWSPESTFVDTLLAGLDGNPLLDPVTASGLFAAVRVAPLQRSIVIPSPSAPQPSGSSGAGTGARGYPTPRATTGAETTTTTSPALSADLADQLDSAEVARILTARQHLAGLGAILPQDAQTVEHLSRGLLIAESNDLTTAPRDSLVQSILAAANQVTSLITLPLSSSITLTSTRGEVPLTVFSAPSLHARVELRLSSQRLIFHVFTPSNGKCRVPTQTSEVCDLTLTTQNTTLKVPVETRSSGVFPLEVSLWAPDGSQQLASDSDTVRSTAVSGVGVVLIVVAIVGLAIWWVRDVRHGRRDRQLVPAPDEEANAENDHLDETAGVAGGAAQRGMEDSDPDARQYLPAPVRDYQNEPWKPRA
jgi:hypothetical protein